MLTQVKAYSYSPSAPTLYLDEVGRAETDLMQLRNIDGLDPVIAAIGTVPYGSSDGEAFVGSNVATRNIVLTIHPNPDWNVWSPEALRRLLYSYFMPQQKVKLEFYSDDVNEVRIDGYVESFAANMFSQDPEYLTSIICPDPYFQTITPVVITGTPGTPIEIDYGGNIPAGILVTVKRHIGAGSDPDSVSIRVGEQTPFKVEASPVLDVDKYLEVSSVFLKKHVINTYINDVDDDHQAGSSDNLLTAVKTGSDWPTLYPGVNTFNVVTDAGTQDWELTYSERFGGL